MVPHPGPLRLRCVIALKQSPPYPRRLDTREDAPMRIRMVHTDSDRDSLLTPRDSRTFDLMLQYSIQLVRCEPTTHINAFHVSGHRPGHASCTYCTGNGILHDGAEHFHLDAWSNTEWVAFRDNFVPIIMRYWDGKFELTPNRPWYPPRGASGPAEAARITCSLSIRLVDTPAGAQQRYFIIKPRETTFRSFAEPERRLGLFTHRDLSLQAGTWSTPVGSAVHNVRFLQSTILHEFGHTLGLHHVGGRGNADANYGTTLGQRQDLMGLGHHATAAAGRPWIAQLRYHLIPARAEPALRFAARVVQPQLITYWDNDWARPASTPSHAAP